MCIAQHVALFVDRVSLAILICMWSFWGGPGHFLELRTLALLDVPLTIFADFNSIGKEQLIQVSKCHRLNTYPGSTYPTGDAHLHEIS